MIYLVGFLAVVGVLALHTVLWLGLRYGQDGLAEMLDAVWDVIEERRFARADQARQRFEREAVLKELLAQGVEFTAATQATLVWSLEPHRRTVHSPAHGASYIDRKDDE